MYRVNKYNYYFGYCNHFQYEEVSGIFATREEAIQAKLQYEAPARAAYQEYLNSHKDDHMGPREFAKSQPTHSEYYIEYMEEL